MENKDSYSYALNSNLVLKGQNKDDKRAESGAEQLPTGEGESLAGKKLMSFGDRVVREKPLQSAENQKKLQQLQESKIKKSSSQNTQIPRFKNGNINFGVLEVNQQLNYRPLTQETRAVYEQILHQIQKHLGDSSIEMVKDAVDDIIVLLKNEELSTGQKQIKVNQMLSLDKLNGDEFNNLVVLTQQLNDYTHQADRYMQEEYQDQQEIAIDLDDEDERMSQDSDLHQVKELSDEERSAGHEVENENAPDGQVIEQVADTDSIQITQIDAFWLQRKLKDHVSEQEILKFENSILTIIGDDSLQNRDCEKKLLVLLAKLKVPIDFIRLLVKQRLVIFFGVLLKQAQSDAERDQVIEMMKQTQQGRVLLLEYQGQDILERAEKAINKKEAQLQEIIKNKLVSEKQVKDANLQMIDFENLKFQQGSRLMANKKCTLPKGSKRLSKPGYEEVYVPAASKSTSENDRLIKIDSLPSWARDAFPSYMTHLNRIQSKLFKAAFQTPNNLLVCAPTGAGKTNIAMLTCLQLLGEMKSATSYNLSQFKIVYIAPMKALVSEVVGNFQTRLQSFGIKVKELTGDVHLTKRQIEETNIIVTTPEKWDIITRKSGDRAYVELVKLIIIDEVHLLHDSRGPVLEAIIARTIRQIEETTELVRIVGLSATLPNYQDVAALLRVDPKEGLFYFDYTYRPVPLEQIYVGVTEKKAIKRLMIMNEVCYEKVMERIGRHQVLVFTHSRKETARTAKIIRDMALAEDKLQVFAKDENESKRILLDQVKKVISRDLQELLPFGIGIHHAGLAKSDRALVEDLFAAGHLQMLVSTATLAWGVNLPAHTVIIKGTQVYSPEQGKWVELSPQDILQMMGRAGRPQYDVTGEGIIITNHSDLQYYLSLNNMQLPIESQMLQSLPDQLNAEIVLGTVSSIKEAVNWLSYTYLYIRMRRNPDLYGVNDQDDPTLIKTRMNFAHSAATKLQKSGMIKYDRRNGQLLSTALGKVASHYYIQCDSMQIYNDELKPHMNTIDIFRLFGLSKEFENIPIRESERVELAKFIDRVPIPVKGALDESCTKINILLQAYIARFKLEGYDLNADMVYITQSAGRIMRALLEIAVKKGWAQVAENLLNCSKMVERRQWYCMTPLRQFIQTQQEQNVDLMEVARRIERKEQFRWSDFYELSPQKLGELLKFPKLGKVILEYVHKFPRLDISAFVQPISRAVVKIELEIKTHEMFNWDSRYHGWAEPFWIFVEDGDSEHILHNEQFILKESNVGQVHHLSFQVPLLDPLPPQYFVKLISDRWLQAEHVIPISFRNLILPEKYAAPTELQNIHPRLISELEFDEVIQIYQQEEMKEFSPIQSQAFEKLYNSDVSVFLGVPNGGSEKRILAEMPLFREIQKEDFGKIVYISPKYGFCSDLYENWNQRLGEDGLGLNVELLSEYCDGDLQKDLQALAKADVVISTPEKWDIISRKWRNRKHVQQVSLYIFENLHHLSDTYETVVSRSRFIQSEMREENHNIRIIGLSSPLANSKDVCDWLGVDFKESCFNFSPNVRAQCPSIGPLQVNIQAFDHNTRQQRVLQMSKPIFNILKRHQTQAIVFVSDKTQAKKTSLDLLNYCISDEHEGFLGLKTQQELQKFQKFLDTFMAAEEEQQQTLESGVAYLHDGLPKEEIKIIKNLFEKGHIRIIVAEINYCWQISQLTADLVILQDPEYYNASEKRFTIVSAQDLLQMQSLAVSENEKGIAKCTIMCHSSKKDQIAKLIQDPLPIESQLSQNLHDHLCAEIVSGGIESIQDAIDWVTWSFMYRRISKNPNFYEIQGKTGQHLNDFLSELIEDTVSELNEIGCIGIKENEMDLEATDLGKIASFYYLKYQTIENFTKALSNVQRPKSKQILEILCQSQEFTDLIDGFSEPNEQNLRVMALNLPHDISRSADFEQPHIRANILLQCFFNRKKVSLTEKIEQSQIVAQSVKLAHALVDIISSMTQDLRTAILCMEISQMLVQAMWITQSPLLQLPFLTKNMIDTLKLQARVQDIADFMNMDDDLRKKLLPSLTESQMVKLAEACNRYPSLVTEVKSQRISPNQIELEVKIKRDLDPADFENEEEFKQELKTFQQPVIAPLYPLKKHETWWLVVGANEKLLGIRKIQMGDKVENTQTLSIECEKNELTVYLICDSYIGCDIEKKVRLQ